jgi:molecular chaperone DnaK
MANGAIVIGCSGYEDPDIAALHYAHRDAARVAATLTGACSVAEDMLLVLSDDAQDQGLKPTRTNIVRRVSGWDRLPLIDGILFCFFSGHGFQSGDDQYFLPIDCVRNVLEDTAVRFDLLLRMISVSPARHVVLFLDACRSAVEGGKAADDSLQRPDVAELCPPGMVSFCSCRPGKASYEVEAIQSGVFTAGLCEALSDEGRCRTIYELDTFLAKRIPEIASAHGKPRQDLYSKVEPLGVQQLSVVSPLQRNLWLAATPIGSERRANSAPAAVSRYTGRSGSPLVAFDFGTSYSAAATVGPDGGSTLVTWSGQRILMPSVVHFLPGLDYLVGTAAVEADRYSPESTIWHVKRSLGTDTSFEIGGRSISPELAASLILSSLRTSVEDALGCPVRRCLASYPANFSIAQRNALQRAFELADLDIYRFIGEPNAAAMTLRESDPDWMGACVVIDLGGGTFDVAVVEYGEGVCEIKEVAGSNTVGGLDFDAALTGYVERELRERTGRTDRLDPLVAAQIRREASRAKRELGVHHEATILLQDIEVGIHGLQDISIRLSREKFREITNSLNTQIRAVLSQVYDTWRWTVPTIGTAGAKILLAGQGSKIFTVRDELQLFESDTEHGTSYVTQFQETAVAYGLGLEAGVISGTQKDVLLLDLSGIGIGVRCAAPAKYRQDGDKKTLESPIILAADNSANNKIGMLISSDTNIPTQRREEMQLPSSADKPLRVVIVEDRHGEILEIGDVMLPGHPEERRVELMIDIDNGNTITIQVNDRIRQEYRRFQLNNLPAMPEPYLTRQYDTPYDLLAAGYALYPVQPIDTPIAAPSSAVRLDTFVQSELAALDTLIADAERHGNSDLITEGHYAMYYRHRADLHKIQKDMVAAALDYIRSFRFGTAYNGDGLMEILPLIEPSNKKIAGALGVGISALDPKRSWNDVELLERLAATLDANGYRDSGARCRQLAAAAANVDGKSND